tara:strand:- start:178 stop:1188 length:1011 start_codon:yes stop_codon:yes gene_type:complete
MPKRTNVNIVSQKPTANRGDAIGSKVSFKKGEKGKKPTVSFKKPHFTRESISTKLKNKPPLKKIGASPLTPNEPNTQTVLLRKSIYGNYETSEILDNGFEELEKSGPKKDTTLLFKLYDQLFYDIPLKGESNSHETLFLRSRDFLRGFVDPKDKEIEQLTDTIEDLTRRLIELGGRPPVEIDGEQLSEITDQINQATSDLAEQMNAAETEGGFDDIEDEIAESLLDENNDGIPDNEQEFSNYGSPRNVMVSPPNSNTVRNILSDPNNMYYKDKHYGREVFKFKKKVKGKKGRIVLYDGAHGKKGKRYLIDIEDGQTYKIKKRHWKDSNYESKYKPD